jgi:ribosome-associated protein
VAPPVKGTRAPAVPAAVTVRLPITLGQFLKAADLVGSGGEAKILIAQGTVRVNGQVEERRGHKLADGDLVQVAGVAAAAATVRARGSDGPGPDGPGASPGDCS